MAKITFKDVVIPDKCDECEHIGITKQAYFTEIHIVVVN